MIQNGIIIPPFQDVEILCCDCGSPFIFTAAEQDFFYDRHLQARKRCKKCTDIRHRRYPPIGFDVDLRKVNDHQGVN